MIRALQPRTLSQLQLRIYSSIRSWQSLANTSFRIWATRDLGFSRLLVLLKIHTQYSSLTLQWRLGEQHIRHLPMVYLDQRTTYQLSFNEASDKSGE